MKLENFKNGYDVTLGSSLALNENVVKYNALISVSNKEDIKKLRFSKDITENNMSKKSFIQTFLQSIKQKMYSNK